MITHKRGREGGEEGGREKWGERMRRENICSCGGQGQLLGVIFPSTMWVLWIHLKVWLAQAPLPAISTVLSMVLLRVWPLFFTCLDLLRKLRLKFLGLLAFLQSLPRLSLPPNCWRWGPPTCGLSQMPTPLLGTVPSFWRKWNTALPRAPGPRPTSWILPTTNSGIWTLMWSMRSGCCSHGQAREAQDHQDLLLPPGPSVQVRTSLQMLCCSDWPSSCLLDTDSSGVDVLPLMERPLKACSDLRETLSSGCDSRTFCLWSCHRYAHDVDSISDGALALSLWGILVPFAFL